MIRSIFLCLLSLTLYARAQISQELARSRAARLSKVHYGLSLDLMGDDAFSGSLIVSFVCSDAFEPMILDFAGHAISSISDAEGNTLPFHFENQRLTIPARHFSVGPNSLIIAFTSPFRTDGKGLHRFRHASGNVYLYSDLEPDGAHLIFPCFDQPDLRATFSLCLRLPSHWEVSANGSITSRLRDGTADRVCFSKTPPIAPYLFNVVTGDYASFSDRQADTEMRLLARQEMAIYVDEVSVFGVTARGLSFFNQYFGVPYPFGKYDQSFVPQYNYGAMENPGSVTINEHYILGFDPDPDDVVQRDQVIFHEQAHMWFGNLVTMKWWDDLWLNESFSSYMEFVALRGLGYENVWQLAADEKDEAYEEDSLAISQPIVRQVADTHAARASFDAITYRKGQSVLGQLEFLIGEGRFRDGIRSYISKHAWQNAVRGDFFDALSKVTTLDLVRWQEQWLLSRGHNTVRIVWKARNKKITRAFLLQEDGPPRQHSLLLGLFPKSKGGEVLGDSIKVSTSEARTPLPELIGMPEPAFIIPNLEERAFVRSRLDDHSRSWLMRRLDDVALPAHRLYLLKCFREDLFSRHLKLGPYFDLAKKCVHLSDGSRANQQLLALLEEAGLDLPPKPRAKFSERLFQFAWNALDDENTHPSLTMDLMDLLIRSATTLSMRDKLVDLFDGQEAFNRHALDQVDRWQITCHLQETGDTRATRLRMAMEEDQEDTFDDLFQAIFDVMQPALANKKKIWARILSEEEPLDDRRLLMEHFYSPFQVELATAFVPLFFEHLSDLWSDADEVFMDLFIEHMFPSVAGRPALDAARHWLSQPDIPPLLRAAIERKTQLLARSLAVH